MADGNKCWPIYPTVLVPFTKLSCRLQATLRNRFLLSHSRSTAFVRGASGEAMRNKSRPLSPLICIILLYGLLQVTLRKERTTSCDLTCMTAKPSPSLNVQSSLGLPFSRKVVLHLSLGRPLGIFSLKGSVTHDKEICNFVHCIYFRF